MKNNVQIVTGLGSMTIFLIALFVIVAPLKTPTLITILIKVIFLLILTGAFFILKDINESF